MMGRYGKCGEKLGWDCNGITYSEMIWGGKNNVADPNLLLAGWGFLFKEVGLFGFADGFDDFVDAGDIKVIFGGKLAVIFAVEFGVYLGITGGEFGLEVFWDVDKLSAPRGGYAVA